MADFRKKMATEEGKKIDQRRGPAAEFPFAGWKERMRLRKFRLFGLAKAGMELMWASLAYNVRILLRVTRKRLAEVAVAA